MYCDEQIPKGIYIEKDFPRVRERNKRKQEELDKKEDEFRKREEEEDLKTFAAAVEKLVREKKVSQGLGSKF